MKNISRRSFNKLGLALGAFPLGVAAKLPASRPMASETYTWDGYKDAFIIDALASPGPFNTSEVFESLSDEMLQNAVASGITAINLTVASSEGPDAERYFIKMAKWERELFRHPDKLMKIRRYSDIALAKAQGKLGLIYGFQNSVAFENNLPRVALMKSFGLGIVQMSYNDRNVFADGCLVPQDRGLTEEGKALIAELNQQRLVIDFSHASKQTMLDGIRASSTPVVISHSACRALADRPRNTTDEVMRLLADKGGVIGIYLMPFLTMGWAPMLEDLIMHIEHAINVCGEDHVGIGSDLSITPHQVTDTYRENHRVFVARRKSLGIAAPGEDEEIFMFVPDLNSPRRMELIASALLQRGHSEARVKKIMGDNFMRVFREVWEP